MSRPTVWKKAKFVIFGLEKANLTTLKHTWTLYDVLILDKQTIWRLLEMNTWYIFKFSNESIFL